MKLSFRDIMIDVLAEVARLEAGGTSDPLHETEAQWTTRMAAQCVIATRRAKMSEAAV